MNKIILKIMFVSILATINVYSQEYKSDIENRNKKISEISKIEKKVYPTPESRKTSAYRKFKHWEYNVKNRKDKDGYFLDDSFYSKALQQYNKYINSKESKLGAIINANWEELGPKKWNSKISISTPGIGHVTAIAVDKNNPQHIIIGSESGGVWRTENGGVKWVSLSDNEINMDVRSLAIDPKVPSTYYWGSTRRRIYKSTDSGTNWTLLEKVPTTSQSISDIIKIAINPNNTEIVFVGISYSKPAKTINAGGSWQSIASINDKIKDIEFKPKDSKIVYMSGENFYKSSNTGTSWLKIPGFNNGWKRMAVTPSSPNTVYVIEGKGSKYGALYKSTNSGGHFTKITHRDSQNNLLTKKNYLNRLSDGRDISNGGGDPLTLMDITVSPTNSNEVHIGGINTWRSLNGGVTFKNTSDWVISEAKKRNVGYCHADIRTLEFVGSKLYAGTDGGIFTANVNSPITKDYFSNISSNLSIQQFYKLGVSQTNPVFITAGSQDNGTTSYQYDKKSNKSEWKDWITSDGMETFIDNEYVNIMYGTNQNGKLFITYNGGKTKIDITPKGKSGNWVTPFEQDSQINGTIYAGYDKLYKSIDRGETWNSISPNLFSGGNISHVKIASSNNKIIYISSGNKLFKTINGGNNWSRVVSDGYIFSIAIHPTKPEKIAIVTDRSKGIKISNDGGASWENMTEANNILPDTYYTSVVWDDNTKDGLYLGSHSGVFYIDNELKTNKKYWQSYKDFLPNVKITELEINREDKRIYAATYGRGTWRSRLYDETVVQPSAESLSKIKMFKEIKSDLKEDELIITPNPVLISQKRIKIEWGVSGPIYLKIKNKENKTIKRLKNPRRRKSAEVDISKYVPGIYKVVFVSKIHSWMAPKIVEFTVKSSKEKKENLNLKISPNPTSKKIRISWGVNGRTHIKIYNDSGERIYFSRVTGDSHEVDVSSYTLGRYFVRIVTSKGRIVKQFIKE